MKYSIMAFIVSFLVSCSHTEETIPTIKIDLNNKVSSIAYSTFIDSVECLTLNCHNNFISGVEKFYTDGDFIFLEATKRGGIFVFSKSSKSLIKIIDYYGKGPGEFYSIEAFTIDRNKKQILVNCGPLLHRYTYRGEYIGTQNVTDLICDFYPLNNNQYICIHTSYMKNRPMGVWLADSCLHIIKSLKNDIPPSEIFQTVSTYYNYKNDGIYYYDRVWDDFSVISRDSLKTMYKFDVKQVVPKKERNISTPHNLEQYVSIAKFAYSKHYIILNYFTFNQTPSYWVLLDQKNNEIQISQNLYNDINNTHTETNNLYYIDDNTWCRVLDFEENDSDLKLEILHIKK